MIFIILLAVLLIVLQVIDTKQTIEIFKDENYWEMNPLVRKLASLYDPKDALYFLKITSTLMVFGFMYVIEPTINKVALGLITNGIMGFVVIRNWKIGVRFTKGGKI